MESSILTTLERAELAARERALAAAAEAEAILAAARADAGAIAAGVEARAAAEIAERRAGLLEAATAEARALEADVEADVEADGRGPGGAELDTPPATTDELAERIVRAVLGEA